MKMKTTAQYNIMTSSDDNLVPYVAVQLTAIAQNLKTAASNFWRVDVPPQIK
jgi:hypothetical protein